jgi:hypothetical protein
MKFLRLLFCSFVLSFGIPQCASAWTHGAAPLTTNNQRVTLNVNTFFLNLAKGMGLAASPTNCASPNPTCGNQDGYYTQAPSSAKFANPSMPAGYYGTFTIQWTGGTAEFELNGGPPLVVSSGGAVWFNLGGTSSVDSPPGTTIIACSAYPTCNGVSSPSTVFAFGWNIQSISNSATTPGLIHIATKTNYAASCSGYTITTGTDGNGNTGPLVNVSGAAANTGANSTWAITNCAASGFDLIGSTFTNAQASAQGQAIFAASNMSVLWATGGTYANLSNFIWAKTGDIAAISAGHYWDTTYVSQLQALMNPNGNCVSNHDCGWLRFMDFSAIHAGTFGNWEKDFSCRIAPTAISYNSSWFPPCYWVGSITNTSDALTVSDPSTSTWNGSAYIDGAIVEGFISATNTTVAPTLNVGGHGAKPILLFTDGFPPIWAIQSGLPSSSGLTMQFTFSASWLNSGTPVVVNYTTVSGDTSAACTLSGNLTNFFNTQTTLTNAGINFADPVCATGAIIYPPSAQAGRLTVTYTSGPAIISMGTLPTSTLVTGSSNPVTFIYNYLEDAWLYAPGAPSFSNPMEVAVDLANQVGANAWWTWGFNSSSYITSATQIFANTSTGLTSGLRFGNEPFNETWNAFATPYAQLTTLGTALGLSSNSNTGNFSLTALRGIQYNAVSKPAWTGQGRNASDFYTFYMAQADNEGVNGNFDRNELKGTNLNTSVFPGNTYLANYGALGGGAVSTNYSTVGNRPVDFSGPGGVGFAPYWGSPWWGAVGSSLTGTVANNAAWLQAQLDYANGLTSQSFTEISNTFNGVTARTDGLQAGQVTLQAAVSTSASYATMMTSMESVLAQYDSSRTAAGQPKIGQFMYEGGPEWAFGNNSVSGTNSASDATSLSTLSARFTALGWNVSAYTFDGTNNPSELAQQILTFSQAWKNDPSYSSLIRTYYYQQLVTVSGANREVHPAQYDYNAVIWALYPGDIHLNNPYQNYNAIQTWNAGN